MKIDKEIQSDLNFLFDEARNDEYSSDGKVYAIARIEGYLLALVNNQNTP